MIFRSRSIAIAAFFALALSMGWGRFALADSSLWTRPMAPWMTLDEELTEKRPSVSGKQTLRIRTADKMATASKAPNVPVITPEDTLELIKQIYEDDPEKPSPLEENYSRRIVDELRQFGYDLFGTKTNESENKKSKEDQKKFSLPAGAAQDNFLLNIGDALAITFRGQRQDGKTYAIDSEGRLIVDEMNPVAAAGRTIGDVRAELTAQAEKLHNTEIFVSLESVRQANILVVGHVNRPGRQTLTVFHTVLDALMEAGGVQKTGSLRQIKLIRDGRSTIIDLYALLIHGSAIMDISVRDGDRIVIPPIGPTVAVAGGVKRPGIYEIMPALKGLSDKPDEKSQQLSLQDMLDMAGGILTPGQNRFIRMSLTKDGHEKIEEAPDALVPVFRDGDILMIAPSDEARAGTVELQGHSRRNGIHAIDRVPTLSALLGDKNVFGPDIYPLIGIIERRDEDHLARKMIAFPPLLVLKEKFDRRLQDNDVVHLFSRAQIDALNGKENKDPALIEASGSAPGMADEDAIDDPAIADFLRERSVFVRGAVRNEGAWPVAEEGISLESMVAAAGGMTLEAATDNIEVTSKLAGEGHQSGGRSGSRRIAVDYKKTNPSDILIGPGDSIRVKQKFQKVAGSSVLIVGEVENPGRYDLIAGDKMSDLLRRAGGLTAQAYPDGAIFSRENERRAEEGRFRAQAQELEIRLAAAMNQEKGPDETKIATVQELVTQLRNAEAVGRITVEADPGILTTQPELDILLEPGDRVYIPKRPLTVRVAGEVLSPASLQFRKSKEPRDYLMEAGGFTFDADKDRIFVIYPDGSAQPILVSTWNHTPVLIPPGSTVVVPRDPKPFDFIQAAKDVSQILSNLAITGIFIDDIRSGN